MYALFRHGKEQESPERGLKMKLVGKKTMTNKSLTQTMGIQTQPSR